MFQISNFPGSIISRITREDGVSINICYNSPALWASRHEESIEIAKEITRAIRDKTDYNRERMQNPVEWEMLLDAACKKHGLTHRIEITPE